MPKAKTAKHNVKAAKKTTKAKSAKGAGRPTGTGKYSCKTKAIRVPEHLVNEIQAFAMKMIKAGR